MLEYEGPYGLPPTSGLPCPIPMGTTFRLMTVNLLHERSDPSFFARVLERVAPDVVVTQELGPFSADVVASAFPNHRLRPALGFTGRGVATRFDVEFDDIDMPGRPGTAAVLDVAGTTVSLAGIHLLNPVHFPWWVTARGRGHQLEGLFTWLDQAGDGPLLVAGDFNASPRWPAYKQMAGRLTDVVADWAEREGRKTERTWGWRPGWPKMLRIDHVFGAGVSATEVRIQPMLGSDHSAVIVDVEVP